MKFGKFEISNYFIGAVTLIIILYIVLYFTYELERLKEQTKQLELQKSIIMVQKEGGIGE